MIASATIGPEGGVITVDAGWQAGLRLTIPAGALAVPTAVRVRDVSQNPAPGTFGTSIVLPPGQPFALEPAGLRLDELATLRVPYRPSYIFNTGPGNVRAREVRNGFPIDYDPPVVDARVGFIEFPVRNLSQYQVIKGPVANLDSYLPVQGTTVALTDGYTFSVEEVPTQSPFYQPTASRWRIRGPETDDLLYIANNKWVGRESVTAEWRETWISPVDVWFGANSGMPGGAVTMNTEVRRPLTSLPVGGQITAFSAWSWAEPRLVAGRLLYDVITLRVTLAWNRQDLGVGQREYRFFFATGLGLVGFSEDAVGHDRTSL